MKKIVLIAFLFLWPSFCAWAEDPQKLLEEAVYLVNSGPDRTWDNKEIGEKLREIRQKFRQSPQSLSATAFLAFYLSQIPGDHSKEIYELCDEVSMKAPNSWQAWIANCAKLATWGLLEGGNQKTLNVALEALAQTDGEKLCRDPNAIRILKPLMDQWPPVATDFTDILNSTISQQACVLGQYELGKKHLLKIVNPRMKALGERRMANYLRENPEEASIHSREKKRMPGTVNDSDSSASPQSSTDSKQVTEPPSANTSRRGSGEYISWFIGLVVIGGIIFFYLRLKR